MARLRRSHPGQPGYGRRRRGRGWEYLDEHGTAITDPEIRHRLAALVIPPAWTDVWICRWPNGHLQAVGTDVAGRRQYRYHADWESGRHHQKFERVVGFGRRLPIARRAVTTHLHEDGMPREKALACAFRLLDRGHFRIGGEVYAESNGSFGLSTLRQEHVRREGKTLVFDYTAKSGLHRIERITDPDLLDVIGAMKLRRSGPDELLAYRDGRQWKHIGSADINAYLKDVLAPDISAKDFRTWHGTVLGAVALAQLTEDNPAGKQWSRRAVDRAVRQAVKAVSQRLGNTPAVCRASYIDPRVISAFEERRTVGSAVRRATRTLADTLPDVVDEESAGEVLSLVAGAPTVERAVLTLLRH
ncbi:DNA topoisomerase IB [Nakamurella sp. YIM 132087]|uniref:DNA topoisomerase n=1 Tax=Nakamurella alba TaxID=2665158 RepID=A0A7K1FIM4_9ACTN|nr:DNA topoisomerase IB [Nakamurella alba]MTD13299.1 DNA topoisomerase IB [Nakamurella alba]